MMPPTSVSRPEPTRLILTLATEPDTAALGRVMASLLVADDVVGLVGTLGAGKTRLSRAIAEAFGVDPLAIASPTFVLIHEYDSPNLPIYHFDVYRLDDPDAFDALGAAEYWSEGRGVCLIEWADLIADRLPANAWWIQISLTDDPAGRLVEVHHPDSTRIDLLWAGLTI